MIFLAFVLAGFSMAIEYSLIRKFKRLLRLMENPKVGPMISLGFSFTLSIMLGSVFGAAGLIVMVAGIMSTVMMQPVYAMIRTGKWDQFTLKIDNGVKSIGKAWTVSMSVIHDIMAIVKLVATIVAIPVYILVKIIWVIARICDAIMDPKAALKKINR